MPNKIIIGVLLLIFSQLTTAQNIERHYSTIKGWNVLSETDTQGILSCYGVKKSSYAQSGYGSELYIGWNGQQWFFGSDFKINGERFATNIEIDKHILTVEFLSIDSLAVAQMTNRVRNFLRNGNNVNLNLEPNGPEFSLSGSAATMLKIQECYQFSGVPPVRKTYKKPTNQKSSLLKKSFEPTQPSGSESRKTLDNYQTFNIAQGNEANDEFYDNTGEWAIIANKVSGNKGYCTAVAHPNDQAIRLGYDGGQWQLAIPVRSKPEWNGSIEIDGKTTGASGTSEGNWTYVWLHLSDYESIRQSKTFVVNIEKASFNYQFNGMANVGDIVERCVADYNFSQL